MNVKIYIFLITFFFNGICVFSQAEFTDPLSSHYEDNEIRVVSDLNSDSYLLSASECYVASFRRFGQRQHALVGDPQKDIYINVSARTYCSFYRKNSQDYDKIIVKP